MEALVAETGATTLIEFDADTLLARFRKGEPVAELTRYPA